MSEAKPPIPPAEPSEPKGLGADPKPLGRRSPLARIGAVGSLIVATGALAAATEDVWGPDDSPSTHASANGDNILKTDLGTLPPHALAGPITLDKLIKSSPAKGHHKSSKTHNKEQDEQGSALSTPSEILQHNPAPKTPKVDSPLKSHKEKSKSHDKAKTLIDPHDHLTLKAYSAEMEGFMGANMAYIPALGCSTMLERDPENPDEVIGSRFNKHCRMLGEDGHWNEDEEGNPTLDFPRDLNVYIQESVGKFKKVGTITEVALMPEDDYSNDQVVASFGRPIREVLNIANANQVQPRDVEHIAPGTPLFNESFPGTQEGNGDVFQRQILPMVALGVEEISVNMGKVRTPLRVRTLVTGVKRNSQDAICSPGFSGSPIVDDHQRFLGSASAYNVLGAMEEGDPVDSDILKADRKDIEATYGVKADDIDALCLFAIDQVDPARAVFAKINTPYTDGIEDQTGENAPDVDKEIPDWRQFELDYIDKFFREDYDRLILDGKVRIRIPASATQQAVDVIADRPAVVHDKDGSDVTMISWRDPVTGELSFQAFRGTSFDGYLTVYKHDPATSTQPSLLHSVGTLTPNAEGGWTDPAGLNFGDQESVNPTEAPAARLFINKGGDIELQRIYDYTAELNRTKEIFRDKNTVKFAFDGVIPGGMKGWDLNKPVIIVNPGEGTAMAVGGDSTKQGADIVGNFYTSLQNLVVYSLRPDGELLAYELHGSIDGTPEDPAEFTYGSDPSGILEGQYTAFENGQPVNFGGIYKEGASPDLSNATAYGFRYENGKLVPYKLSMK